MGQSLPSVAESGMPNSESLVYELEAEAVAQLAEQVAQHRTVQGLMAEVGAAAQRRHEQLAFQFEQRVSEALQHIDALTAELAHRASKEATEALEQRMAKLEQDEQVRYREYDAAKPKQPVLKLGVRPRHRAAGEGAADVDVQQESQFATKARGRRSKA